jgi:hypothetical protein
VPLPYKRSRKESGVLCSSWNIPYWIQERNCFPLKCAKCRNAFFLILLISLALMFFCYHCCKAKCVTLTYFSLCISWIISFQKNVVDLNGVFVSVLFIFWKNFEFWFGFHIKYGYHWTETLFACSVFVQTVKKYFNEICRLIWESKACNLCSLTRIPDSFSAYCIFIFLRQTQVSKQLSTFICTHSSFSSEDSLQTKSLCRPGFWISPQE